MQDGAPAGFDGEVALGVDGDPPMWLVIDLYRTAPTGLRFERTAVPAAEHRVFGPEGAWEDAFAGKSHDPPLAGHGDQALFERMIKRFTKTKNWLAIRAGG